MTKTIYLAGGCYWGVEKYISEISGVLSTEVGFANGDTENPTYQQVRYENTGHAETVKVEYDPEKLPLTALLNLFYKIIDPTSVDQQGEDIGHQYRTGVYFSDGEDETVIRASLLNLEKEVGQPLAVECCPLLQYYTAEEYHQKYLDKNPSGYCHVPFKMIQWVKTVDPKDFT
ncbi:MAG: peptide-methionine (S)-S-oxide reductase MsrA [Clostridia bacterium]|nr:peptide-methionine (S)-S-oxide reductase MsrA [Clostridia bacterium]